MERKRNYSVCVSYVELVSSRMVNQAAVYSDIYAFNENDAVAKAESLARKEGHNNAVCLRFIPGAICDHGPAPLYNYTMELYYYDDGPTRFILKNVETDTDEQAIDIAKKFFRNQFPKICLIRVVVGAKQAI